MRLVTALLADVLPLRRGSVGSASSSGCSAVVRRWTGQQPRCSKYTNQINSSE